MNFVEHDNIFELLSVDLDMSEVQIKKLLINKGKSGFMDFLKNQDMGLHKTSLTLGSEITDPYGKVLINSGIEINQYLASLLDRYIKDEYFQTNKFRIECDNEAFSFYRGRSTEKVDRLLTNKIFTQKSYKSYYDSDKVSLAKANFDNTVSNTLSTSTGITLMLKMLNKAHSDDNLVVNSFNSSFISLSLTPFLQSKGMASDSGIIIKTGIVGLMQDIASILGFEKCIENKVTSSKILTGIINDESMEEAIRMKNCAVGNDCAPVFSDRENRNNFYLRILVTVNLFVDLVFQNNTEPGNLEVHKSLYELSELGYADPEVSRLLGKLFLPELKYMVLQQAYKIKDQCCENPIIWSATGDMLPVRFLCPKDNCVNAGQHKTFIPEDIQIKADEIYETRIKSGLYFSCAKLTDMLQVYYKSITTKS